MKKLFLLALCVFPGGLLAQSCLEDAVQAIQNVDGRGNFVSVQCNSGREYSLRYETSCWEGDVADYLLAQVVLSDADDQFTCAVSIDGSGGVCPTVSTSEHYYQTRSELNKNRKLIRQLCQDLPWKAAKISISGDDAYELYVNGTYIGGDYSWLVAETWNAYLQEGKNVIAVKGINNANGTHPGAVIADISIGPLRFESDSSWMMSIDYVDGWNEVNGALVNAYPAIEYGSIYHATWWNRYFYGVFLLDESEFPLDSTAQWIWSEGLRTDAAVYFRKEFFIE